MFHSRFIRILVSLCLIAGLIGQPMAVGAARGQCNVAGEAVNGSPSAGAPHQCDGCGHCEVLSPEELCGCCSVGQSDAERPSCCGNASPDERKHSGTDPIFGELSELVPEPGTPESNANAPGLKSRTAAPVLASVCMCSMQPQPGTPMCPRAPVSEGADAQPLALGCTPSPHADRNAMTGLRHRFEDAAATLLLDYQCHFCVWRL